MMSNDSTILPAHRYNGTDPLSLEELLRSSGPHALDGKPPTDEEVFERLDRFGREFWRVGSVTQREVGRQTWTDYFRQHTIPGVQDAWRVVQKAIDAGRSTVSGSRYHWYTAADLAALPPPEELIRGVLPVGSFAMIYGPRGIGKTFLALDLACTTDSGGAWHGHVVRRGRVAYVLAEGRGGLARRISAWQSDHGEEPGVRFLTHAVRLLDDGDVDRLIDSLTEDDEPLALLVLDTLARCLVPGDENSTRDMGVVVAAVDRIREATGTTVLAVHHTGHDKTRERGSTALGGALDTVMSVARSADVLTLTCEKQRDSLEFPALRFRLHPVGESVVPRLVMGTDGMTGADATALEALVAIEVEEGVPMSVWDLSAELGHGQLYRSRKKLLELGLVRVEKDGRQVRYWPVVKETKDRENIR